MNQNELTRTKLDRSRLKYTEWTDVAWIGPKWSEWTKQGRSRVNGLNKTELDQNATLILWLNKSIAKISASGFKYYIDIGYIDL